MLTSTPDDPEVERIDYEDYGGVRMLPVTPTAEQRDAARASDLYKHGDMLLRWVNEGDLFNLMAPAALAATTPRAGVDRDAIIRVLRRNMWINETGDLSDPETHDVFIDGYQQTADAILALLNAPVRGGGE